MRQRIVSAIHHVGFILVHDAEEAEVILTIMALS